MNKLKEGQYIKIRVNNSFEPIFITIGDKCKLSNPLPDCARIWGGIFTGEYSDGFEKNLKFSRSPDSPKDLSEEVEWVREGMYININSKIK